MSIAMPLEAEAVARLAQPPGRARGLPREVYFDPAIHAAELEHVFRSNWVFAGIAEHVAPTSVYPVTVGGAPILLVRNAAGELSAFHNVCSHRGALLATEPRTKVKRLVCPYHCWSYDLAGRLLATPNVGGHHQHSHADLDKSRHGLRPVPVAAWAGLVFVNVSGTAPPFAQWLKPLIEQWSKYDFSLLRHGGKLEFTIRANWKLALENFAESYHLPSIHPGLNSYSALEDHFGFRLSNVCYGQGSYKYAPDDVGGRKLPQFPNLPAGYETRGEYPIVFPNAMLGVSVDHVFALIAHPTSPTTTHEEMHIFFVGDAAMREEFAENRRLVVERWRGINYEDVGIVESVQIGRNSPAMEGGLFSPTLDICVYAFQNEVARCLTESDVRR